MELELYTLQTDKYSTKAIGIEASIEAKSNTKLFTIVPQLFFIKFAFYLL